MKTPYFIEDRKGNKKHYGSLIQKTFYIESKTTKKIKIPEKIWDNLMIKGCKAIAISDPNGLKFYKLSEWSNGEKKIKNNK